MRAIIPNAEDILHIGHRQNAPRFPALDFASALYLGLRHPSRSLRPWSKFTTGMPAALVSPTNAEQLAYDLAQLQGCEQGVLGTSTLHLFWDLFGMLAKRPVAMYVDAGAYPIARWGIERAAARGISVNEFAHHDAETLWLMLRKGTQGLLRPVVVTDGFCPDCGKPAPLSEYLDCVRAFAGRLIVDDTQALGIFGHSPSLKTPYGLQGGGTVQRARVSGPDLLVISSLAKAFGAPVAILSGSQRAIEEFKRESETRVHCSPPSLAVIRAAEHALHINRLHGSHLRLRLAHLVMLFRQRAARAGLQFTGGLFPVQTLHLSSEAKTLQAHRHLKDHGIRTVLRNSAEHHQHRITFVITARHTLEQIDRAIAALAEL